MDRLGKYDAVFFAILHLLENGSTWVQGHAARTLGNLLPSVENLKTLAKLDSRNTAASAVRNTMIVATVYTDKSR